MALRLVDIIFFFAVLILMILIVTLIYFIKINNETEEKDLEETQEMKIAKELRDSMKIVNQQLNLQIMKKTKKIKL